MVVLLKRKGRAPVGGGGCIIQTNTCENQTIAYFYSLSKKLMAARFFRRYKLIILYGLALSALLFLLKWLEWRFIIFDHAIEIYSGAIALVFTGLGIWLALKLARPKTKTVYVERPADPAAQPAFPAALQQNGHATGATAAPEPIDQKSIARLGLSTRELEVLQLMAEGLSNQEIAGRLFVSLNTIKTHSSNIFGKLDVRRRTQAIETARRLKLIMQNHSKV
jgi:two-component system, NarL family, response regulator LiaR